MTILEQAQNDLGIARSDVHKTLVAYRAAVAKLKDARARVDKLLITKMELDYEQAVLAERRTAGR